VDSYTKLLLRESTGGISQQIDPSGEVYRFYLSGKQKSYFNPSAYSNLEYYDEYFNNINNHNVGRVYKEINQDNSSVIYKSYWGGTDRFKNEEVYSADGSLVRTIGIL